MKRRDSQQEQQTIQPVSLTQSISKADKLVNGDWPSGKERAREFACLAIFLVSHIFLRNEHNDRYLVGSEIVDTPKPKDTNTDDDVDLDGTVLVPVAGLIPVTVLDWSKLREEQRRVILHTFTGTEEEWGEAQLVVTNQCQSNHLLHESLYGGSLRLVLGNWCSYAPDAALQVLLVDLPALIRDAQSGSNNQGSIVDLEQLEAWGPSRATYMLYKTDKGWATVLLRCDGVLLCIVILLAVMVCMMLPVHPKMTMRLTDHTIYITYGGVLSTNTSTTVEVPPVLTWGGSPVFGGADSADVLNVVGAVVMQHIVRCQLQFAPTEKVARLLRKGLQQLPPSKSMDLPEVVILALTASLQRQAQLSSQ